MKLADIIIACNDRHFKDRTAEFIENAGCEATHGYAGYDVPELADADRDEDLASEIWAEIHMLVK